MRNSNRLYALALLCVLAGSMYAAASLFLARYSRGDVYPPYSSFRADPLGAKAFFEALRAIPGLRVVRNVEPLDRVAGNRAITLFVNGLTFDTISPIEMESGFAGDLQKVMVRGGRVVISFAPVVEETARMEARSKEFRERMAERWRRNTGERDEKKKEEKTGPADTSPKGEQSDDTTGAEKNSENEKKEEQRPKDRFTRYEDTMPKPVSWENQWGVTLQFDSLERDPGNDTYKPKFAGRTVDAPLPDTLPVHSTLYFEPKTDQWRTLYAADGHPVLIERSVGDGSLVLVADAYLVSNEAMRADRHPDLLAWLAGANSEIVFDEVTLGVERGRGIASLMWQYRLQGIVAALIVMAALFIWKNGQPLVPPFHDALPTDAYAYAGKDSASGFTNLLRRAVPESQVLRVCLAEWEKSFAHRRPDLAASVRDAKAIVLREDSIPASQRDPAKAYKEICDAFAKHRLG